MKSHLKKTTQWLAISITALLLVFFLLLGLTRLFNPYLLRYHSQLQVWLSQQAQRPISFGQMAIEWQGTKPTLTLHDLVLWDTTKTHSQFQAKKIRVGINLWQSLYTWHWQPDAIEIAGTQLILQQQADGQILVNGIQWASSNTTTDIGNSAAAHWLLTRGEIRLQAVDITWHGKNGLIIPLTNTRLTLKNGIVGHHLTGAASLSQTKRPAYVTFASDFQGNPFQRAALSAAIHFDIRQFEAGYWLEHTNYAGMQIKQGIANVQGKITWNNGQLQDALSSINFADLVVYSTQSHQDNFLPFLNARLHWQKTLNGWIMQGDKINLKWNNSKWPETYFSLEFVNPQPNQAAKQTFQTNFINVADLSQFLLASQLLTVQQQLQLQTIKPAGTLHNITLQNRGNWFDGQSSGEMKLYQMQWRPWNKIPGINNLTGIVKWQEKSGQLELDSQQMQLALPKIFQHTLFLGKVSGQLSWRLLDSGWQLSTSGLEIANRVFTLSPSLQLTRLSTSTEPIIDLTGTFTLPHLQAALAYLPSKIMSVKLVSWLKQAILAGRADNGSIILRGPLTDFPYDKGQGQFAIKALLHNAALHFDSKWPSVTHINGAIGFAGRALSVDADSAKILATPLTHVKAAIPDLQHAVLRINGQVAGDMRSGITFLSQSPLQHSIGKELAPLNLQGPMQLHLDLTLPLEKELGKDHVLGELTLAKDSLLIPHVVLPLTQLQGELQFTEDGLSANAIQGNLLQKPVTLSFNTLTANKARPTTVQVELNGSASTNVLQHYFVSPWWRYAQGALNYQVNLLLPMVEDKPVTNTLIITSNLHGIAMSLPPPFAKTSDQIAPVSATVQFANAQPFTIALNYNNQLSTALTFTTSRQGYAFTAGELHLGPGSANLQTLPGLVITGQLTQLEVQGWQALLADWKTSAVANATKSTFSSKGAKNWLRAVDVFFPQLTLAGQTLQAAKVRIIPTDLGWQVDIASDALAGHLLVPSDFPRGTLIGNFQQLYLRSSAAKNPPHITPEQIPSLDLTIDDFHYADKNYGRLKLQTITQNNQLKVKTLNLQSNYWDINATADWSMDPKSKVQQTTVTGTLQSVNVGQMLKRLAVTEDIAKGKGNAAFHLSWIGAPTEFDLNHLEGSIIFKVTQGRIINLKKSTQMKIGLGRILTLMSLETIPRRLQFDFSDLTKSGFAFDILESNLTLNNGNLITQNTYLNGPVAKIALQGHIGLDTNDCDVILSVTPYVTSSLPVVATIAGGPVAGAATWVANKVFGDELNKITNHRYRITGSWQQPTVTNL